MWFNDCVLGKSGQNLILNTTIVKVDPVPYLLSVNAVKHTIHNLKNVLQYYTKVVLYVME